MEVDFNQFVNVIKGRLVCSIISLISCFFIIVLYIILLISVKFQKKEKIVNEILSQFKDSESFSSIEIKGEKKVSLGTHYMFFLILSKFLWCILSIYQCIKYPFGFLYLFDKYITNCVIFGFIHNYLELISICWTTFINKIFMDSIKFLDGQFINEKKELLKAMCLSVFLPLLITLFPLYFNSYGPAKTYCSFDYLDFTDMTRVCWFIYFIIIFVLIGYNTFAFIKIILFYCKQLKKIKKYNKDDYNSIRTFMLIFGLFPLILIINTFLKSFNRYKDLFGIGDMSTFQSYFNCLSGFLKCIPCLFFYRGVFKICCKEKELSLSPKEISLPEINEKIEK